MFFVFGNLDYVTVFSIAPFIHENTITIIGLLLLLAAMGKSAQMGLHTWLPDDFIHIYTISTNGETYIVFFSNFASKSEQGPSPDPTAKINARTVSGFLYSFLLGLLISRDLVCRTHKQSETARLVHQTFDKSED